VSSKKKQKKTTPHNKGSSEMVKKGTSVESTVKRGGKKSDDLENDVL